MLAAALSGTATARRLRFSEEHIRAVWAGANFEAPFSTIRCPMTLEGRLLGRTFDKVPGGLIGEIIRARIREESCTPAETRIVAFNGFENYNGGFTPNSLPWSLTYEAFRGTLPNIGGIRVEAERIRIGVTNAGCTAQYGKAEDHITFELFRRNEGIISAVVPVTGENILNRFRVDAGTLCPTSAAMSGTGDFMVDGGLARVTVTLI